MRVRTSAFVAALVSCPVALSAQLKTSINIAPPTAAGTIAKMISLSDFASVSGTSVSAAKTYMNLDCGAAGCAVAKAAAGTTPAVSVHLGGTTIPASELRTGLIISHDVPHSLTVSLNGSDVLGLLCNGKGTLTATPKFTAMGATNSGFSWQLLDGGKVLKSGHGSGGGEGIVIDMGGHVAGVMQLAVSDHGVISIEHGTQKLVIASDTKDAIGAKTGGYLKFEDLGLRVSGTADFAVVNTALRTGVQPPGV